FAVCSNFHRPVEIIYERFRKQQLTIGPVQDIEEPVPVRLNQQLPRMAFPFAINQDKRLGSPSSAIRRSQARANSKAPARAVPEIAAITGFGILSHRAMALFQPADRGESGRRKG